LPAAAALLLLVPLPSSRKWVQSPGFFNNRQLTTFS
jgi:hypothetical protein